MAAGYGKTSLNGEFWSLLEHIKLSLMCSNGFPRSVQRCFHIARVNPERINLAMRGTTVFLKLWINLKKPYGLMWLSEQPLRLILKCLALILIYLHYLPIQLWVQCKTEVNICTSLNQPTMTCWYPNVFGPQLSLFWASRVGEVSLGPWHWKDCSFFCMRLPTYVHYLRLCSMSCWPQKPGG